MASTMDQQYNSTRMRNDECRGDGCMLQLVCAQRVPNPDLSVTVWLGRLCTQHRVSGLAPYLGLGRYRAESMWGHYLPPSALPRPLALHIDLHYVRSVSCLECLCLGFTITYGTRRPVKIAQTHMGGRAGGRCAGNIHLVASERTDHCWRRNGRLSIQRQAGTSSACQSMTKHMGQWVTAS
jgi:hypothetical protein